MEIAIEGILLSAAAIAVYLIGGVYCFIWSRAQAQSRAATWPPEAQGRRPPASRRPELRARALVAGMLRPT